MKGLREKFRKNSGFTLIEMLIVVAIIAILIAVSIPLVSSSLDKAKQATDDANVRSAVGVATVEYLQATTTKDSAASGIGTNGSVDDGVYYVIDKGQGSITKTKPTTGDTFKYGRAGTNANKGIKITVSDKGAVSTEWVD